MCLEAGFAENDCKCHEKNTKNKDNQGLFLKDQDLSVKDNDLSSKDQDFKFVLKDKDNNSSRREIFILFCN